MYAQLNIMQIDYFKFQVIWVIKKAAQEIVSLKIHKGIILKHLLSDLNGGHNIIRPFWHKIILTLD